MSIAAILGIGSSILGALSSRDQAKQSGRDARENIKLTNEKFQRDKLALLHDQAFARGTNLTDAGGSGLDVSSFQDVFDSNELVNQLDLEQLRFNNEMTKRGFERDKSNASQAARNAVIGGIASVGSGLIGFKD